MSGLYVETLVTKYGRSHIGEVFTTNEGYSAEVIDGGTKMNYCSIKILDWTGEAHYDSIKRGKFKYPYHLSVLDVACIGEGKYKRGSHVKMYRTWLGMLTRVYDESQRHKHPTYKDVSVHKDWLNFQTFGKWFEENYINGWDIDKDLLSGESKIYGPDTCVFIPPSLNNFMTNVKSDNTSGRVGVSWHKRDCVWQANIRIDNKLKYLGSFNDLEKASDTYKKYRKEQAKRFQLEYQNILPLEVILNIK